MGKLQTLLPGQISRLMGRLGVGTRAELVAAVMRGEI